MVPAPLLLPTCLTTEVVHIRLNQRQPPRPDRVACRTMAQNESTTELHAVASTLQSVCQSVRGASERRAACLLARSRG